MNQYISALLAGAIGWQAKGAKSSKRARAS
jgi:hypothetical protein